jgi:imidazolonepropionase-like amidohydrolase
MSAVLFTGGQLLDPEAGTLDDNVEVLVVGDRIALIGPGLEAPADARRIALGGRTLMPGMIDAHVHVVAEKLDLWQNVLAPDSLVTLYAARMMEDMLQRGFTTLRDLGGADIGLVRGVEQGLINGPRLVICGKGLTMTGGHADIRARTDLRPHSPSRLGDMGLVVDGVDDIRKSARDMIKGGASFIKIMANGGVASPNDPIHSIQFSADEIRAVVEEAENAGLYVSAHLYTDAAIRRCVELGVHSLEHCNLIEPETAALAAARGCIAVPTLVAYEGLSLEGRRFGFGDTEFAKIDIVRKGGLRSLQVMRDAGLEMAFGSDLLGELRKFHSMEFELLAKVVSPAEIIRSATRIGAKLCGLADTTGRIAPGYAADLVVVDGNPLEDILLLGQDGKRLALVMQAGRIAKNTLDNSF